MTDTASANQARDALVERLAVMDTTIVYDVFAEAVSSVLARYGAGITARKIGFPGALWTARIVALQDFQDAVGPDDRDAMIDGILLLKTERTQFEANAAQSVA